MKMMDCVEVIVEKACYAKDGIHKGMQGWICLDECISGYWLVCFPQYGEKPNIATTDIHEKDMILLSNGMNAKVNERIRAEHEGKEEA